MNMILVIMNAIIIPLIILQIMSAVPLVMVQNLPSSIVLFLIVVEQMFLILVLLSYFVKTLTKKFSRVNSRVNQQMNQLESQKTTNFLVQLECLSCKSKCVKTISRVKAVHKGDTINSYCGNPLCRTIKKQGILKVI